MKITLEMIITAFKSEQPDANVTYKDMPQPIESIRLFPKDTSSLSEQYLYVTDVYNKDVFSKIRKTIPVICFTSDSKLKSSFENISLICSSLELADGFNLLLQSYNYFIDWGRNLDFEVFRECSFQDLLDISKDMIPCPILVYDPALKLLAYSGEQYASKDPLFQRTIKNGYMDIEAVHYFESTNTFEQLNKDGVTYGSADEYRIHPDAIKAINANNQLAIYCALLLPDNPSRNYLSQLFDILCEAFDSLMKKHHTSFIKDRSVADYFLMDLLDNPETPAEQIKDRLHYTDLDFHGCFSVITIHSDIKRKFAEEYFITYLRNSLTGCRVFEYKDIIIILYILPETHRKDYKNHLSNRLLPIFQEFSNYNLRAYVSKPFSSIAAFAYAYSQADHAFSINNPSDSDDIILYFYEDYWISDLVMQNPTKDKKYFYCEPCILELANANTSKSKQQLTILYEFITNDRNSTAVADKLFMHRNNVIYHIKQLQETYNLNLDDYQTRLKLQLSFEILKAEGYDLFLPVPSTL